MAGRRAGSLIAATWLIGLGVVFLVRQAMGWTWGEAWPLFVILVGVGSLASTIATRRPGPAGIWSFTWPMVWMAVGLVLLLSTTGRLESGPGEVIARYWPWLLIVIGGWFVIGAILPIHRGPTEQLALPLGDAAEAEVRIEFGAGQLTARAAAAGNLVDGTFAGGVRQRSLGANRVALKQDMTYGLPWFGQSSRWDVGLTAEVPLDLRLDTGASRAELDLGGLRLRSLELHTGASETRVILPRTAGATSVRAESGAASLTIEVPSGVAARIRSTMFLGSIQVDQNRFPRVADGYQSADYATATDRADIEISAGVGSVRVIGGH